VVIKKTAEIIQHLSVELATICSAAGDDIARHGLGCTKQLEECLEMALRNSGRALIEALITQQGIEVPDDNAQEGESYAGKRKRIVDSLFGPIEIERNCYHNTQMGGCRYPMDDALFLINGVSPAVASRAAMRAAVEPFGEASATCDTLCGLQISPYRIRKIAQSVNSHAADFIRNGTLPEEVHPACVAVEVDGKGAPIRRKELQEAGVKGKNGDAKTREVKAAAIFTFNPNPGEEEAPQRDANSTHYLLSSKTADEFGKELWAYYQSRFPGEPPLTIFISDAAAGILNIRTNWLPFATGIIDFHHAVEHLQPLLEACGFVDKEKEEQHKKWRNMLLYGKVEQIIKEAKDKAQNSKECKKALSYFIKGKEFMSYDLYRAKGWFIGSGVIEAACKNVVAERFCKSGMFWSRGGLDAMLPLRAVVKSQRYVKLWDYALKEKRQIAC
jgi:hypothetical protein